MLRVRDVPPEEMSEVVRVAGEIYDRERSHEQGRKAVVDAAEEMGIPAEYLERAAAEVHARRVAQTKTKRRRRNGAIATLAAAVAIGGGWRVLNPAPPAAWTLDTGAPAAVTLSHNPETTATTRQKDGAAVLNVNAFRKNAAGDYFANLTMNPPPSLAGYDAATFRVRGSGTLREARLYLENGPNERWRSPAVSLTNNWQTVTLPLDRFERQRRASANTGWRVVNFRAPEKVRQLSFKVGEFMNDVSATGEVAVDDITFR